MELQNKVEDSHLSIRSPKTSEYRSSPTEEMNNSMCYHIRKVLVWYEDFSSIGGLSQIAKSKFKIWKGFWTILFLLGAFETARNVILTISDYLDRHVSFYAWTLHGYATYVVSYFR